ncbi:MAG: hypothetical protein RL757_1787 [Bacteroidota bacterium]|jgi:large subunit ribosomal protein L35
MPKIKTHSGGKKRFSLTGSGKVKRFHANHSHLMRKKSATRKGRLVQSDTVSAVDTPRIKTLLGLNSNH